MADLVVDASGHPARTPLASSSSPSARGAAEITINSFLGYASRIYAIPQGFDADWRMLFFQPQAPATTRGGGLFRSGNRWIVTIAGAGRGYPPTDRRASWSCPWAALPAALQAIRAAEPLTVSGYQRTENQRRLYGRCACPAVGDLGDATCAFNPIYGQNVTVAADTAVICAADRVRIRTRPGRAVPAGHRQGYQDVWLIATGEDLRYPTTEGDPGPDVRMTHRYLDRVLSVAIRQRSQPGVSDVFNLRRRRTPSSSRRPAPVLLARRSPLKARRPRRRTGLGSGSGAGT
jgi:hypothetical protein